MARTTLFYNIMCVGSPSLNVVHSERDIAQTQQSTK